MGVARPLSLLQSEDRPTPYRALHGSLKDRSNKTPLGIGIDYESLAFPEPGCLAAQSLQY